MVSVSATEQGKAVAAENDRERQARQAQQQQLANTEAWDRYVDSRIQRFFDSHRADDSTLPDALHEALGQILAEERWQWRRERALIEAEARRVTAELRATISELSIEIRQKALETKPDLSAEALREALGQMFAEERRQWQRERELLQSEAAKTLAEFRAQTVEWHNEFTSILNTRHRQFADTIDAA